MKLLAVPAATVAGIPSISNLKSEIPTPEMATVSVPLFVIAKVFVHEAPGSRGANFVPFAACAAAPLATTAPFVPSTCKPGAL